jgi:hypothetical protein
MEIVMSSDSYCIFTSTHALLTFDACGDDPNLQMIGAMPIVLYVPHKVKGDRVFVVLSCWYRMPEGSLPVGDGETDGLNEHGDRLWSIPARHCRFLTDEEAESYEAMRAADEQLLIYARG